MGETSSGTEKGGDPRDKIVSLSNTSKDLMKHYEDKAHEVLIAFISNQSNLFAAMHPSRMTGEAVAEFCIAFTHKYSEHLEKLGTAQTAGESTPAP
jgi:site-specific recombinase XerD